MDMVVVMDDGRSEMGSGVKKMRAADKVSGNRKVFGWERREDTAWGFCFFYVSCLTVLVTVCVD